MPVDKAMTIRQTPLDGIFQHGTHNIHCGLARCHHLACREQNFTCEKRDLTRDLRLAEEAQADHCQTATPFVRLCAVDLEWVVKAERHWMREFTECWEVAWLAAALEAATDWLAAENGLQTAL